MGDPALTNSLDSLAHRRTISALSLYYIYYHGVCSVELKSIIPPKTLFTRNTRFSNSQHLLAFKLDKNRTSAFANSFIPMTSRDWNSLRATVFPATYNFSCLRPTSTDTFNSYPAHKIPLFFFFSRWRGQSRPLGDAPFRCISFSHQFH